MIYQDWLVARAGCGIDCVPWVRNGRQYLLQVTGGRVAAHSMDVDDERYLETWDLMRKPEPSLYPTPQRFGYVIRQT